MQSQHNTRGGMARGFQRVDISRSVRNPLSAFDAN